MVAIIRLMLNKESARGKIADAMQGIYKEGDAECNQKKRGDIAVVALASLQSHYIVATAMHTK